VVVADSRSPRDGKFIEIIGTYDPKKPGDNSTLKLDRAEYWISKGAQASDTVRSLIKKIRNRSLASPRKLRLNRLYDLRPRNNAGVAGAIRRRNGS